MNSKFGFFLPLNGIDVRTHSEKREDGSLVTAAAKIMQMRGRKERRKEGRKEGMKEGTFSVSFPFSWTRSTGSLIVQGFGHMVICHVLLDLDFFVKIWQDMAFFSISPVHSKTLVLFGR